MTTRNTEQFVRELNKFMQQEAGAEQHLEGYTFIRSLGSDVDKLAEQLAGFSRSTGLPVSPIIVRRFLEEANYMVCDFYDMLLQEKEHRTEHRKTFIFRYVIFACIGLTFLGLYQVHILFALSCITLASSIYTYHFLKGRKHG